MQAEGIPLTSAPGKYKKSMHTISNIMQAAQLLMKKKGFVNVTVRDICAAAGVSTGSFYSHFSSKEQLMAMIFTNAETGRKELNPDAFSQGSCRERLFSFVKQYAWVNMSNTPEELKVILSCYNPIFTINRHWDSYVEEIIAYGLASKEIRPDYSSAELANILLVCLRGCSYEWCRQDGNYDLEKQMITCSQLLFASVWTNHS